MEREDDRDRARQHTVQRSADSATPSGNPGKTTQAAQLPAGSNGPYRGGSLFSGGAALPGPLQRKFEGSLGVDLSGVRVHTGDAAASSAKSVSARAYAVGQDIHFGAGQYDPGSSRGQQLLAHEVAHTVQQRGAAATPQFKLDVTSAGDACEVEADRAADAMVTGRPFSVTSSAMAIARQDNDRAIDTSRSDTSHADRDRLRTFIARLDTAELAQSELDMIRLARDAEHSVIELVYVQLVGTHEGVHVAAGDLDGLVQLGEVRVAELQVAGEGPSFAGLAERGVAADRIAALTALGGRYRFGGGGVTSLEAIGADMDELARLTAGLPALDPMSAVSLRQTGVWMRQVFFAVQAETTSMWRVDDGSGMSLEEYEERQRRYLEAGEQIREGLFAGLFFSIAYLRTDDRDEAARWAGLGAAVDGLVNATGSTLEAAHAAHEAPRRDGRGRLEPGPTVVGIDGVDAPARPEPVREPVPRDVGEPRTERRARERSSMAGHADRLGATRRR